VRADRELILITVNITIIMMHPRNPALRYLLLLTIVNLAVGQRVKLVALVSNLVQPVAVLEDPIPGGKRKFVVEKGGTVRIASGATGTILGTFLNFRSIVTQDVPEGGMLGMAFHPDYARNGYFFVNYTQRNNGKLVTIIRRLRVSRTNRNRAVVGNPVNEILMRIDQPFPNHNGGQLVFSPGDKMLYIGTGDGGGAGDPQNNSQNKKTLLGKILRINPTVNSAKAGYTIPDDNPYAQSSDGSRREIWHYGLRNPWRFTFDRATADMWIGDGTWRFA
jgi:glucose/arabinose dehydrogenase